MSVENKRHGVPRIENLRAANAAMNFLSVEPLLEDLGPITLHGIKWVIVGGESGPGAREMKAEWVTSIKRQCDKSRIPFFFKQWGGVQKSKAGRQLNGRTYDALPSVVLAQAPNREARKNLIEQFGDAWPTNRCNSSRQIA